ncbi:MAG: hypothetical protein AB8F74_19430 [Saprospiraceae bacterium]
MFNNTIISNLIDLKANLKEVSLIKILTFLNVEIVNKDKNFAILEKKNSDKYLIFKTKQDTIDCINLFDLNIKYKVSGFDLLMDYLDLTRMQSLQSTYEAIINTEGKIKTAQFEACEKKSVLEKYFGIKQELKKIETHQLIKHPIFITNDGKLAVNLYNPNQSQVNDMMKFDLNSAETILNNPYATIKYKLENLALKNSINLVFHPKYLITSSADQYIDNPYILFNNNITQSEIDKVLFNEINTDKEILKATQINLVSGPFDNMIGCIQLLHYILNSMVDYVHFNLEVKSEYINITISWKIAEGIGRELRLALSNSLKTEIHKNIFERYYSKVLGNTKYSENIDLLLDKTHKIEKRQSYVNKKKDLVLYRLSINSLSLYEYARHMIRVFELENVSIQNCLKH